MIFSLIIFPSFQLPRDILIGYLVLIWSGKKYTPFPIWSLLTLMLAFFSLSCLIIPCFWTPGCSISITLPVLFVVCARALMRLLFTFSASVVLQLTCGTNWHYFLPPISISTPSRLRVLYAWFSWKWWWHISKKSYSLAIQIMCLQKSHRHS